jgi:RNA polymerase sigma factor (sigma-70 family)
VDERAEALERLYRHRYGPFRNAVAPIVGSYEAAHDAVQEGFTRALTARHQFRQEAPLEVWVWRIVLRTATEQARQLKHHARMPPNHDPQLVEPERDPVLADALRELPPRRRLIVFLRFFADLSYADIAEICDISIGTVSATIAQSEAALERSLDAAEGATR